LKILDKAALERYRLKARRAQRLRDRWERLTEAEREAIRRQFETEEAPSSAA